MEFKVGMKVYRLCPGISGGIKILPGVYTVSKVSIDGYGINVMENPGDEWAVEYFLPYEPTELEKIIYRIHID